jgi:hypothetical protein
MINLIKNSISLIKPNKLNYYQLRFINTKKDNFYIEQTNKKYMKFSITQFEIDKTRSEAKLIKKVKPVNPLGLSDKIQHFRDDFRLKFITTFLPKDFPNSVGSGYWPFTKYQFLSNVAGTVTGVLSMQSLLFAVGLGNGSIPVN